MRLEDPAVVHFLSGLHLDFFLECPDLHQINIYKLTSAVYANSNTFRFDFKVGYKTRSSNILYIRYYQQIIKVWFEVILGFVSSFFSF